MVKTARLLPHMHVKHTAASVLQNIYHLAFNGYHKRPGRYINPTFSMLHPERPTRWFDRWSLYAKPYATSSKDRVSNGEVVFGDGLAFEETLDQCDDAEIRSEISDQIMEVDEDDSDSFHMNAGQSKHLYEE